MHESQPVEARINRRQLYRTRMIPTVLAGSYCWIFTVATKALHDGVLSLSGLFAVLALVALLVAPAVPNRRIALILALDVFVLGCVGSWWAAAGIELDVPLSVFGSFGWVAYTFALGALSKPSRAEEVQEPGPELHPRTRPSKTSALVLLSVVMTSLFILGAAWKVERPALAVLSHVLALGVVLILLRTGAHLAVRFQVKGTRQESHLLLRRAALPLIVLVLLAAGAIYWASKGARFF